MRGSIGARLGGAILVVCTSLATPAVAEEETAAELGWLYELSAGILAHDVDNLWSGSREENGLDLNVGLVLRRPSFAFLTGFVRPYLGVSVNTRGDTSKLYGGFVWQYVADSGWFLKLGLGGAVHDGERETLREGKKELGSQVLFHIPIELGRSVRGRHRVSLYFDHVSNASLADENEGLDTLGLRYGYLF